MSITTALPPHRLPLTEVRSILVIQFRYLGDMVLLSALFHNLHLHLPQARLAALTDDVYTDILRNVPDLDEIIPFPRQRTRRGPLQRRLGTWFGLVRTLRAGRFDMVIDVANTSTSRALVKLTGASLRVGYHPFAHEKRGTPYNVIAEAFRLEVPHFIDHYLQPLQALGLSVLDRNPVLQARSEDSEVVARMLQTHGLEPHRFAVIHPGARVARKCWPAANFARVAEALEGATGLRTVLVGGAGEQHLRDAIYAHGQVRPVDLVGRLSVGQLVALMSQARLFIGNDSGPMHIAAAAGIPVIALFGPSEARFWAPVGPGHTVLERACHCGLNTKVPTACDTQGPECLQQITPDEVIAAARDKVAITD